MFGERRETVLQENGVCKKNGKMQIWGGENR